MGQTAKSTDSNFTKLRNKFLKLKIDSKGRQVSFVVEPGGCVVRSVDGKRTWNLYISRDSECAVIYFENGESSHNQLQYTGESMEQAYEDFYDVTGF